MIKIINEEFEITQIKNSNLYELKLMTIVNSGKENEHKEMKLYISNVSFIYALKTIISQNLSNKEISISLSEYIKLYSDEVNRICKLLENTKQEDTQQNEIIEDEINK